MAFRAKLFTIEGPGGWTFAKVPARHAPPVTHGWGRTPVVATVDGKTWDTSVWRDKKHGTVLALPKHIRGAKTAGDTVVVELAPRGTLEVPEVAPIERPRATPTAPARTRPTRRR